MTYTSQYYAPYKACTKCGIAWRTQTDFLSDRSLKIIGYQACFRLPERGLFLFAHNRQQCRTTLSVPVGEFRLLYAGLTFATCNTGEMHCPLYCLDAGNLDVCINECSMSWIRAVLQDLVHGSRVA